jgi:hypothetical protein
VSRTLPLGERGRRNTGFPWRNVWLRGGFRLLNGTSGLNGGGFGIRHRKCPSAVITAITTWITPLAGRCKRILSEIARGEGVAMGGRDNR